MDVEHEQNDTYHTYFQPNNWKGLEEPIIIAGLHIRDVIKEI